MLVLQFFPLAEQRTLREDRLGELMLKILKSVWKSAPQPLRLLFCKAICAFHACRRHGNKIDYCDPERRGSKEPVFVCGPFASSSGVGRGARLYADELRASGKKVVLVDITTAMRMHNNGRLPPDALAVSQLAPYSSTGTVVIHANPPQFQLALCALGKGFLKNKHITAYWSWELETLPLIWKQAFAYTDSIETPSTFVRDIIAGATNKPVALHPHILPFPARVKSSYARDGLLRCLYIFDAGSSFERKNPLAALSAFRKAFAPGEASLTFKITNSSADNKNFREFRKLCSQTPGVRIVTDTLDGDTLDDLYLAHDVYLSLHRSEGFGLTILEAMRHGLYTVATAWSGNMDFMKGEFAYPVPFSFVSVNQPKGAFKGLATNWAEPDTEAAAEILRNLRRKILGKHPDAQIAASGAL